MSDQRDLSTLRVSSSQQDPRFSRCRARDSDARNETRTGLRLGESDRRLRVPVHLHNREPLSSSRLSRNSSTAMPLRLAVPLSASSNFFEVIIELH